MPTSLPTPLLAFFCLLSLCAVLRCANAGTFEDLGQSISSRFNDGVKSVQDCYEKAKHAIEETEAHAWLMESMIPSIKQKFEEMKDWIREKTTTVSIERERQEKEKYKVIELDEK